jgi:hypothetical protein
MYIIEPCELTDVLENVSKMNENTKARDKDHCPTGISSTGTNWDRLRSMTDEEIERNIQSDPDILPTDIEFWKDAVLVIPRLA